MYTQANALSNHRIIAWVTGPERQKGEDKQSQSALS